MTPETELLPCPFEFGDPVRLLSASPDNPRRDCFFVRCEKRLGKLNAGRYFQLTDGKGDFWTTQPSNVGQRPAPKAIEVEALKREVFKHFCPAFLNYDPYACIPVSAMIDHLNSRGLFGQVDQVAVDALKKINAMPYYLEPVPESQISSLVKRYNKCLDIAEETLQALEKTDD